MRLRQPAPSTGTATLYAAVLKGHATAATGNYVSSFTGADAVFYYQEGITLDCSAPTTGTLAQASFSTQATVAANCLITVDDINFGVHGLIESEVIANGAINLSCTPGANHTVARDRGLTGPTDPTQRLMRSGTNTIA